jgi:hypothetical protein
MMQSEFVASATYSPVPLSPSHIICRFNISRFIIYDTHLELNGKLIKIARGGGHIPDLTAAFGKMRATKLNQRKISRVPRILKADQS